MSRPLKITRENAIEAAMYVFWEKGYNATTVDDLQNAMGLQRGSFYSHFKDKKNLFIEVLDHYKSQIVEKRRRLVRDKLSPSAGILLYFDLLLEHLMTKKPNAGCLNTNSATELGLTDRQISQKLKLNLDGLKDFWIEILKSAQRKKEISKELDIPSTAHLLVALTQGLNVVARVNPDPEILKNIVKAGLIFLRK